MKKFNAASPGYSQIFSYRDTGAVYVAIPPSIHEIATARAGRKEEITDARISRGKINR